MVPVRATATLFSAVVVMGFVAACDSASTSPAQCDGHATSASFVDGEVLSGVVSSIAAAKGSTLGVTEIVTVRIHGDPDFTIAFTLSAATAVFERSGSAAPTPANSCSLAAGQQVQLPPATYLSGFGDYIPVSGNDPAPPIPPTATQIVIVH
jgi:hypothetical protein